MQGLSACARRLEIKHRLNRICGLSCQRFKPVRDSRIDHPVQADLVPAMHMDHSRKSSQRLHIIRVYPAEVTRMRPLGPHLHIVVEISLNLAGAKKSTRQNVAIPPERLAGGIWNRV